MCLVIHVPHASLEIPADIRQSFVIDDATLEAELLALTDRFVDEIVAPLSDLGATIIRHPVSRLLCDPERYPDDADEPMSTHGMGAISTLITHHRPLRPAGWTETNRETVMQSHYWPHTRAMAAAVTATLAQHDRCYILDAHSFPITSLPFEDPTLDRPQLCLGHNQTSAPKPWLQNWEHEARTRHLTVARNTPFAGAYIPMQYRDDPRVHSLMIEFRRDLYMNEQTGDRIAAGIEMLQDLTVGCCHHLAKST